MDFDLVHDGATEFFAPVSSDLIDGLIGQYQTMRKHIDSVAAFAGSDEMKSALHYFLDGNATEERGRFSMQRSAEQLFDPVGAIASLNASYWSRALQLTDVLDMMPQKRRDEWNNQIKNPQGTKRDKYATDYIIPPLPEFTDTTVRDTLVELLRMRGQFLAERVDGIFRGLSGDHVTNAPEGFGKRMIIARVLTPYDTSDHSTAGLINDLRCVIAKFMGRDEPKYYESSALIDRLRSRWGEWVPVDGGAFKIRLYKKGTAHMEVHPDMAWRLNAVLAQMHPTAIPASFRQKPKRKVKDVPLMQRPLPFAVLGVLARVKQAREKVPGSGFRDVYRDIRNTVRIDTTEGNKAAEAEAARVLQALGGTPMAKWSWYFEFDYDPLEVIKEIVVTGCIPDQKAHQFYPTPQPMARRVAELIGENNGRSVLEPSAGQGGIASEIIGGNMTLVEVSPLQCKVLEAKGFANVVCADFLEWAKGAPKFDAVAMNPPFDQGRWLAHVEAAASLVSLGGRLVAILPSGAKSKLADLDGFNISWRGPFDNEFAGTSVSVVILVADRVK